MKFRILGTARDVIALYLLQICLDLVLSLPENHTLRCLASNSPAPPYFCHSTAGERKRCLPGITVRETLRLKRQELNVDIIFTNGSYLYSSKSNQESVWRQAWRPLQQNHRSTPTAERIEELYPSPAFPLFLLVHTESNAAHIPTFGRRPIHTYSFSYPEQKTVS